MNKILFSLTVSAVMGCASIAYAQTTTAPCPTCAAKAAAASTVSTPAPAEVETFVHGKITHIDFKQKTFTVMCNRHSKPETFSVTTSTSFINKSNKHKDANYKDVTFGYLRTGDKVDVNTSGNNALSVDIYR